MATMKAAQVTDWSQPPKLSNVPRIPAPTDDSAVTLKVLATAIHQVVRSRASGQHYTSGPLPHIPGVDGTGIDPTNSKVYYFSVLGGGGSPSKGTFSEEVVVARRALAEVPEDVDPVLAAALVNPVMSSWMALKYRVELKEGWSCLIIGATSASGRIAVKVARQLGAVKVFGAARRESELKDMELDGYAVLNSEDPFATDFSAVSEATVLLDYLWGPWPSAYLTNTAKAGVKTPLQIVSIGAMAGEQTPLPSAALRSRDVTVRGAGPGAWSPAAMAKEAPGMLAVLKGMKDDGKIVKRMKLEEVEEAWKVKGSRVVLVNDQ